MILIINKPNPRFMQTGNTTQVNGLSVCLSMIQRKFPDKIVLLEISDFELILQSIKTAQPKAVIFQANQYGLPALVQLKQMFPNIDFFVHIHSKFPFLQQEKGYVGFIHGLNAAGIGVIFNSVDSHACFDHVLNIRLDNIYQSPVTNIHKRISKPDELHVGCHGSLRLLKNTLFQAFVAKKLAEQMNKKLVFHINNTRNDGEADSIILSLLNALDIGKGHFLKPTHWLSHSDFIEFCSLNLDLGMQLSMSETFNIVTADYVSAGVPVIAGPDIDWVSSSSKSSTTDFNNALMSCNNVIRYGSVLNEINRNNLNKHKENAIDQWGNFLNNYT